MSPLTQTDGHDAPGLVDQAVPGVAAVVEDILVGCEDAVRQPVVAHELPHVLDRVELGALGRQWQQRDDRPTLAASLRLPLSRIVAIARSRRTCAASLQRLATARTSPEPKSLRSGIGVDITNLHPFAMMNHAAT